MNIFSTMSWSTHPPSSGLITAIPRLILELANATITSPRVASTSFISIRPTLPAEIAFNNGRSRSGNLAGLIIEMIFASPLFNSLCT